MDILAFNKKINKISVLSENVGSEGNLSSLERDLLLSYIRELYDIALDGKPSSVVRQDTPKVAYKHPEPVVIPHQEINVAPPTKVEPTYVHPVVMEEKPTVIEHIVVSTPAAIPVVEPKVVSKPVESPKPVVLVKPEIKANPDVHVSLDELFTEEKVVELSDKISLTPVKDLTRAMGINERIFNQQELFANNQAHFSEVLEALNKCQSFSDAKQYLQENVIPRYSWTAEDKSKNAASFIKLVKRKFLA